MRVRDPGGLYQQRHCLALQAPRSFARRCDDSSILHHSGLAASLSVIQR